MSGSIELLLGDGTRAVVNANTDLTGGCQELLPAPAVAMPCRLQVGPAAGDGHTEWVDAAELYVRTLATAADLRPDPPPGPALTRDRDDDYVIHLARAHDVDCIVSGDADLLEWDEQDPPVTPPAEFEARLSRS